MLTYKLDYVGVFCNVAKSAITLENPTPPIGFLCEFCKTTIGHHYISIWQLSKLGCENVETSFVARLKNCANFKKSLCKFCCKVAFATLWLLTAKGNCWQNVSVATHLNVACSTTTTALFANTITPLTENKFSNTKVLCAYPVCC